MLTPKQEMFVQGLVEGLSQRNAYKQAYNCDNMITQTIDNKAYKLFANDELRVRYKELLEMHKDKALYTREAATMDLIWLKEQARESIEETGLRQANGGHFLNSVKELCVLEDLYPSKEANEKDNSEDKQGEAIANAITELREVVKDGTR